MIQVPCDECKKPNINCECGLKEELTIQKVLNTALEEYEKVLNTALEEYEK